VSYILHYCNMHKTYLFCLNHFLHQHMHLYIYIYIYIYIYYQSLKHFVHLIAPTRFDTQRVIHHQGALLSWLKSLVKNIRS
jgi:hypothetical protein